jgi:hypothetical protein
MGGARVRHFTPQEGERLLRGAGRYAELAALFKYHGLHDSAMEVLRACSQSPDTLAPRATGAAADLRGLPGVWAAVRYMTHLTCAQAPLIRRHSSWVLAADPEAGLQARVLAGATSKECRSWHADKRISHLP